MPWRELPARIEEEVRRIVVFQYFSGEKPEVIAKRNNISYGTVRNVIRELMEGHFPEYDDFLAYLHDIRWLLRELKRRHRTLPEAIGGFMFLEELLRIRVDPAELSRLLPILRKLSPPGFQRDAFARALSEIIRLVEAGLSFVEMEEKAVGLRSDVAGLEKSKSELEATIRDEQTQEQEARQSLDRTLSAGKQEIRRLEQSKADQLASNNLTEDRLAKYVQIHTKLVSHGVDFERLETLVRVLEELETHGMQPRRILGYLESINSLSGEVENRTLAVKEVRKKLVEGQENLEKVNNESSNARAKLAALEKEKTELLEQLGKIQEDYKGYLLHIDMARTLILLLHDPSRATNLQLLGASKLLEWIVEARKNMPNEMVRYDRPREALTMLVGNVLGKTLVFKEDRDAEMSALRNENIDLKLGRLGKLQGEQRELRWAREMFEVKKRRFEEASVDKLLEVALAAVKRGEILLGACKSCGARVAMVRGAKPSPWSSFSCSSCHSTL